MRATVLLTILAVTLSTAHTAGAQAPPELDVQHFHPHANQYGWFATESAQTLELWQPAFGLWFNYAHDPFVHRRDGIVADHIVADLATMDLQAGIGFGVADIAIDVPIHVAVAGEGLSAWGGEVSGAAMGDLRVQPKIRFVDPVKRGFGLGLALPVSLPTGNQERYVGLSTVAIDPTLLVTGHLGDKVRLGGNLGAHLTGTVETEDLNVGPAFIFRAAVGVSPIEQLELRGEVFGLMGSAGNPVEWLAGACVQPVKGLRITVGGGSSLGLGISAPEGRIVLGVGYTPVKEEPVDTDGDGLIDRKDDCPTDPEDFDGFEDEDGCPELDNDQDGIPDTADECPLDPEDIDGFEDEDGCPDNDNDGDGFPDSADKCPDEAEVVNEFEDEDGCPDEIAVLDVEKKEIVIYDKVYFDLNEATIKSESYPVLDAVRQILADNPEVVRLEIQGHTDSQGMDSHNQQLSEQRAAAVRTYLIGKGIDGARLEAKGYGESQLLDAAGTEEAHGKNRRVQFIVLQWQ